MTPIVTVPPFWAQTGASGVAKASAAVEIRKSRRVLATGMAFFLALVGGIVGSLAGTFGFKVQQSQPGLCSRLRNLIGHHNEGQRHGRDRTVGMHSLLCLSVVLYAYATLRMSIWD
jgi:hypothetical protein